MEGWVFKILIRKLKKYALLNKIDIYKNSNSFFIMRDFNYYIIVPKKNIEDFILFYFVDVRTNKITYIYKTKLHYYRRIIMLFKRRYRILNLKKIEEY